MDLIVTLKKEVEDVVEGQNLFNNLKNLLSSVEGVIFHARVTTKDLSILNDEEPS